MTRRQPERRRAPILAAAALLLPLALASCGEEQEQVQAPPPPPPPRQLGPLEDLDMDPRVQFPETREPSTRELAMAIADLASALISGDDAIMADLLDDKGKAVLRELKANGQWRAATSRLEAVRVCVLEENDDRCVLGLGLQDPDGAYILAWSGQKQGEGWTFSPLPVRDIEQPSVAMLDGVPLDAPDLPQPVAARSPGADTGDDQDDDEGPANVMDPSRRR